jgi:hypothetical protein
MAAAYAIDPRKDQSSASFFVRLALGYVIFVGALGRPMLLPFAGALALSHVANQGSHPHTRDSVGLAFLPFAYAIVECVAAQGVLASLHPLLPVAGASASVFLLFLLGSPFELAFRRQASDRRQRMTIARATALAAIGISIGALAHTPLLLAGARMSPRLAGVSGAEPLTARILLVWGGAAVLGLGLAILLLRATRARWRTFEREGSWRAGYSDGAGAVTFDDGTRVHGVPEGAASWTGPVVVVPLGVVKADTPYRAAERASNLIVPGTVEDFQVAVWDTRAGRYALAAATIAITSAPLLGASIAYWRG